ncbi:MAG: uracil-DNA glycosylase, partial [Steroidobacteraceae bacterium]
MKTLERFLDLLSDSPAGPVFNPWMQRDAGTDLARDAAADRRARLIAHLDCKARLVLVGEGAGYQGAHVSGIA